MMKTVLTFLLVLLLFPAAATAQEYNIPDTVPLTINLREEPRGFEGPLYQYALVLDNSWTKEGLLKQIEPFLAPGIRSIQQVDMGREYFYYQHPDMPIYSGNATSLAEPMQQQGILVRKDLEAHMFSLLEALHWGDNPWVQGLLHTDEWSDYWDHVYHPQVLRAYREYIRQEYPAGTTYLAAVGRCLGGYPLTEYMENMRDDYFVSNTAGFVLDETGQVLQAAIPRPWRITDTRRIEQPLLTWQQCIPLLEEQCAYLWGKNGIRLHSETDPDFTQTQTSGELVDIQPVYVVRNLRNGRFVAMPAWQMSVIVHTVAQYTPQKQSEKGFPDVKGTRRYTYVYNALTGAPS